MIDYTPKYTVDVSAFVVQDMVNQQRKEIAEALSRDMRRKMDEQIARVIMGETTEAEHQVTAPLTPEALQHMIAEVVHSVGARFEGMPNTKWNLDSFQRSIETEIRKLCEEARISPEYIRLNFDFSDPRKPFVRLLFDQEYSPVDDVPKPGLFEVPADVVLKEGQEAEFDEDGEFIGVRKLKPRQAPCDSPNLNLDSLSTSSET